MAATARGPSLITRFSFVLDERRWASWSFVVIALLSISICAVWAARVPFLQGTDEQAHADYAYALFDAGGWFAAREVLPADHTTEQIRYLQRSSNFWALRFYDDARAPLGYGSPAYYAALDRYAPKPSDRKPRRGAGFPYVAFSYPITFYALAAVVMRAANLISGGSLTATYFAARGLGVAMLLIAIAFSYGTLRRLRYRRSTSLALTATIGLLPLVSWVCGYIQPDTAIFALVSAALYLTVSLRKEPADVRQLLLLGAVLTLSVLVKPHYGLVLTMACSCAMLSSLLVHRGSRLAIAVATVCLAILPSAAYVCATSFTPIGHLGLPNDLGRYQHSGSLTRTMLSMLFGGAQGVIGLYGPGKAFDSFWFQFGDFLTAEIAAPGPRFALKMIVCLVSIGVCVAIAVRQCLVYARLYPVAKRHWRMAISLLFGDIMLTLYFSWLALLLAVLTFSAGKIYLEGRYFLPIILPTILLGVRSVPRLARRPHRSHYSKAFVIAWLVFAIAMCPAALTSMNLRFYGPDGITADRTGDAVVVVAWMKSRNRTVTKMRSIAIPEAEILRLSVYVASQRPRSHVSGLRCLLDGRAIPNAVTATTSASLDALRFNHFLVDVPGFSRAGPHRLELVGYVDGQTAGHEDVDITVSSPNLASRNRNVAHLK